jgi:hypothetical protein
MSSEGYALHHKRSCMRSLAMRTFDKSRTMYITFFHTEDGGSTFLTLVTIYQTARCHFTFCSCFVTQLKHRRVTNASCRTSACSVPTCAGSESPPVLEEAKEMCGKGVRGDGDGKGVEGMRGAPLLLVFLGPTYSSIAGTVPLCSGNPPC